MTGTVKVTAEWHAVHGLVIKTAYSFHRRYGGDLDDILSEAQWQFLRACLVYREDKNTPLPCWVRRRVWHRLIDKMNKDKRKTRKLPTQRLIGNEQDRHTVSDYDWMETLGDDARAAVEAILNPPPDVDLIIAGVGKRNVRSRGMAVRQYLRETGWPAYRVQKAFAEIKSYLRGVA